MKTDGWNREATPMTRKEYGVWELILPAKDGQPAISHNSKVKVRSPVDGYGVDESLLSLIDFYDPTDGREN